MDNKDLLQKVHELDVLVNNLKAKVEFQDKVINDLKESHSSEVKLTKTSLDKVKDDVSSKYDVFTKIIGETDKRINTIRWVIIVYLVATHKEELGVSSLVSTLMSSLIGL